MEPCHNDRTNKGANHCPQNHEAKYMQNNNTGLKSMLQHLNIIHSTIRLEKQLY